MLVAPARVRLGAVPGAMRSVPRGAVEIAARHGAGDGLVELAGLGEEESVRRLEAVREGR